MKKTKVLVVYTENFKQLFDNFKTSLRNQPDLEIVERLVSFKDAYTEFKFKSESWYEAVQTQVFEALEFIKNEVEEGEYFIISDVDIHFFQPEKITQLVEAAKGKDLIAVKEERDSSINSGFIIAKRTKAVIDMYEHVYSQLQIRRSNLGDQDEINHYIVEANMDIGYIHRDFAGMGKRYSVKKSWIFFHAINTRTLSDKLNMISRMQQQYNKL